MLALKDTNKAEIFPVPVREQSIIVGPAGYYPEKLTIFEGERIRFFLTSATDTPSCLIISEKNVFLSARKGEIGEGEAYFDTPGVVKFYCPAGKIEGKITVLKRPMKEERSIASEKVEVWKPKEE